MTNSIKNLSLINENRIPMNWNIYNSSITLLGGIMLFIAIYRLYRFKRNTTAVYFYWGIITSVLVILQLMLIDTGFSKKYPAILLFYLPYQFITPLCFTLFTYAYLKKSLPKKLFYALLLPFICFFILYILLKINVFVDHQIFSKTQVRFINNEIDENCAVIFALFLGVWNFSIIKLYEESLGSLSYTFVIRKTKWLKNIYAILVFLCLFWVCTIIYIDVNPNVGGNDTYYALWLAFLLFYYLFTFRGNQHLTKLQGQDTSVLENNLLQGLNQIYNPSELYAISQHKTTFILTYFATSLFDKNNVDDVLWDITENCIAQLDIEDCIIYVLDEEKNALFQKTAYGGKHKERRKILSPIEINIGEGIVGTVAEKGKWELIENTSLDSRYIVDDIQRFSELAVPIYLEEQLFGVLDSEHSQKSFFTSEHINMFQLIAKLTEKKLLQIKSKRTLTITNDNAYYKEVCSLMDVEKLYRNPNLKLTVIAKKINISSNYLSQLINTISDYNFSDFINNYRVKDAQQKLTNPAFKNYTILSIGLESGFNSKSAFYAAFRKKTGVSPSEYKEKHPFTS